MNPAWAHWLVKRGKEFIWSAPQMRTIDPPRLVTWRIAPLRTIYNSGGTHLPPCGRRSTVPRLSETTEHLALFHEYIISPIITRKQCSKRCVWPCWCLTYPFRQKLRMILTFKHSSKRPYIFDFRLNQACKITEKPLWWPFGRMQMHQSAIIWIVLEVTDWVDWCVIYWNTQQVTGPFHRPPAGHP
jgi:hypothetical protein